MTRTILLLVLLGIAGLALGSACTADLEDHCVSGPCGPDAQPVVNPSTSSAGAGGGSCADFPATGDLPCDVWEVLHARCHCCHQKPPQGGAPFPLLTYENTHEPYSSTMLKKWERMNQVIQPNGLPHMPFGKAQQLNAAEKKTLDTWFAACAPPADQYGDGGPGCDDKMPPPAPDTSVDPPEPGCEFTM